jgi:hypothetical protein
MKTYWLCAILILLIVSSAAAQSPAINLPLIVYNDAGSKLELHFGLDPSATDTLDRSLGEQELPPFPPADVLEVRFIGDDILLPKMGLGTYSDYRMGDADFAGTKTYELKFQIGSGTKITFKWNLPKVITGLMQDFFNGVLVNKQMIGSDSLVLTKPIYFDKLQMIIKYTGIPLAPILVSPKNDSSNVYLNPGLIWRTSRAANSYRLQVDIGSDFSQPIFDISGIADTAYGICDLEKYKLHYWRVMAINTNGTSDWSETWHFTTGETTPVLAFDNAAPSKFYLSQNYPNPFNPMTIIRFAIPQLTSVKLQLFDLLGREIAVLIDEEMSAGEHHVVCKLAHLPNGVYFYRLSAGQFMQHRKMILLK